MKRVIRFRGRCTDTGEWVFGDLIHGVGSKQGRMYILPVTNIYPKGCNELDGWEVIPETVCQFTGLLDKNGKEIYEGDIIRVSAYINRGQGETYDFRDLFTVEDLKGFHRYDFISDIKFNEGGFYLSEYSECDTSLCVLFGDMRHSFPIFECEVLGNIHDNTELLKGGKKMSELQEAAKQYSCGLREVDDMNVYDDVDVDSARMVAFKRGAEWQAKQSSWISVEE